MQTVFPAIEPLYASEAAADGSLPIVNINIAGASTYGTNVRRHGLMLKIAKQFVEESTYPWINYWLRLAGNALARHKEENIFSFITSLGVPVFDTDIARRTTGYTGNDRSIKGLPTGRNHKGQFNGSMTVDDVFDMFAATMLNGFIPDVMLIHPMAWLMWVKDPVMREFAIQAGGGSFFQQWTGNAAAKGNQFYNFGGQGFGVGQQGSNITTAEGLPQNQNSAPILPNYLVPDPWSALCHHPDPLPPPLPPLSRKARSSSRLPGFAGWDKRHLLQVLPLGEEDELAARRGS